jgi:hypothetical protein
MNNELDEYLASGSFYRGTTRPGEAMSDRNSERVAENLKCID